ncbi:MAG: TM0996/MTH895 family glutaredoxin-like protein [Candidatus Latescibacterota bacterium]|nr:MAG: TM0996/MTH895 family glutaredoxin-like protein [Candidatus Latescibacterota bacterium]
MKKIKVLGPGCAKCRKLFENVEKAVRELGIDCEVEKVTDINAITDYRVMITPALVVDEVVKSSGKALSVSELKNLLG